MPCYQLINGVMYSEFIRCQHRGFTGSFEDYEASCYDTHTGVMFLCGDLGEYCADCGAPSEVLCDYPVEKDKTCDRATCEDCAKEIGPDIHYCEHHYEEWKKFRESGGVENELKNVMPFKVRK